MRLKHFLYRMILFMLNYLSINRMSLFLPYLFLNIFNSRCKGWVHSKK